MVELAAVIFGVLLIVPLITLIALLLVRTAKTAQRLPICSALQVVLLT